MSYWTLELIDSDPRDRSANETRDRQAPLVRGYWFDEEVCRIAGIGSASILKKLSMQKAAVASYVGTRPKGRKRAWTARNVFRVFLASRLAQAVNVSFIAAGTIVEACGLARLERLACLDEILSSMEKVRSNQNNNIGTDISVAAVAMPSALSRAEIAITNGEVVSWISDDQHETQLARIINTHSTKPRANPIYNNTIQQTRRYRTGIAMDQLVTDFVQSL
jgi:hypothetical protein